MLITDFITAFQKGKALADAHVWKNRTTAANLLTAFLGAGVSIAVAFGYRVDIDQDTLAAIAGGIAALGSVLNAVSTTVTSEKVGVSKPEGE